MGLSARLISGYNASLASARLVMVGHATARALHRIL